jgi:hypothetical protein
VSCVNGLGPEALDRFAAVADGSGEADLPGHVDYVDHVVDLPERLDRPVTLLTDLIDVTAQGEAGTGLMRT